MEKKKVGIEISDAHTKELIRYEEFDRALVVGLTEVDEDGFNVIANLAGETFDKQELMSLIQGAVRVVAAGLREKEPEISGEEFFTVLTVTAKRIIKEVYGK